MALLLLNIPNVVVQNAVHALPQKACLVTASAAIETSLDGTTWTAFTLNNDTAAPFVRATGAGNTTIFCKPLS